MAANRLVVGVRARQTTVSRSRDKEGRTTEQRSEEVVFHQFVILDHERDYVSSRYDFSIAIPPQPLDSTPALPDGTLGDIARVVSYFTPQTRLPLRWEVYATLEAPRFWKFNLKARRDITVSPPT
jgi:hypothetical protein